MAAEPTLALTVARLAAERPAGIAFHGDKESLDWASYHERSALLAGGLRAAGLKRGERVAVLLPEGPGVHVAYLACEKAGLVVMGIGYRAGADEIRHLVRRSGARALLAESRNARLDLDSIVADLRAAGHPLDVDLRCDRELREGDRLLEESRSHPRPGPDEALRADEIFLLNSTSGTTGLPKCVAHDQARWFAFHGPACSNGELTGQDVFLSALPAPFGFGLWTAHFTPALLGVPCVLPTQFTPAGVLEAIERHRVSVLATVSTQFILMLESPGFAKADLSSLRVLFTGGEAVPEERAAAFEDGSGACVLQFYGSNEVGAVCGTSTRDTRAKRLATAGRVVEGMELRLLDATGEDATASGRGQPACRGPQLSRGYWDDDAANAELWQDGEWMKLGDIVERDADGYLSVVGRTADIIIRGGKNLSAPAIEAEVVTHPAIRLAAAVAVPDAVFGERVCICIEPSQQTTPGLEELRRHLEARGVSKEWWPEYLVVMEELPRASGGKLAKGKLREIAREECA